MTTMTNMTDMNLDMDNNEYYEIVYPNAYTANLLIPYEDDEGTTDEEEKDEEGLCCLWCGRRPFMGQFVRDPICQKSKGPMELSVEEWEEDCNSDEYPNITRNRRITSNYKHVMTQLRNTIPRV